jgi:menaquinone-dependent protoporphyrinogen oxidase
MDIIVAVASKHGSTREIAQVVAAELRKAGLKVDVVDMARVQDLMGYDGVVLGSAVYAGSWLSEAREFAQKHLAALSTLPVWVFSSGPLGNENPENPTDLKRLAAPLGGVPIKDHRLFDGELDPEKLGLGERLIARAVGAPTGDYRDWHEIRTWAAGIAGVLRG